MTVLVVELSNLFSILSDRNLEVMLAELIIRKKTKNLCSSYSSSPRIILVPCSGQCPMQQCFIGANLMSVVCHSWEGDDLWGNDDCE